MRKHSDSKRMFGILALGVALVSATAAACSGAGDDDGALAGGGCPDDLEFFQANVYEPILSQKCVLCHSQGGLAQGTRLVLQNSTDEAAIKANFETVRSVAAIVGDDGKSILVMKPSGQHENGHTGGTLFEPGSPQYQSIETFVDRVTKGKSCDVAVANCDAPTPGPRMLRRLSREEYDATVSDLFQIESTWGDTFSADTVVNGFDNNAAALRVSPLLADQARRAAEEIAKKALENPASILSCDPATGDAACAHQMVDTLGKRAFRRPLTDADRARYNGLYDAVAAEDGFLVGVETVISAMLQSPNFLYRTEIGEGDGATDVQLTQHEIASELSYFLWGTMPDPELMAAADAGELATPEQLEAQARRMLADARADAMLERFAAQWLDVARLATVPKDAMAFPDFDMATRAAMGEETARFVRHVVREGEGTLTELLGAKYSFTTPELAAFYGLPAGEPDADGMVRVDLTGTPRAGLLTQGSVLATHAKPNNSSPIHRGKLVRERLLCQPLPPPPPGLDVKPPAMDPTKTTRERYSMHSTEPSCASCHRLVDPIGFGFEHFDGVGRYRDQENGLPIDVSGEIVASESTAGTFQGTEELAAKLAASPDVHACFSLQWLRFAYGVEEDAQLSCTAGGVAAQFAEGGLKVEDAILALIRAPHFTKRVGESADAPTPGDGTSGSGGSGGSGSSGSGSGSGSTSSSSSGGGDPPPPPPPPTGVDVNVDASNDWGTGYCANVEVTNSGSAVVTWVIELEVEGTMTDLWNATSEPAGAKTRFRGVDQNGTLDPGEKAQFGFCANR